MLRELSVQNLALIEDIRVELEPGFCAWTGETGAGKTLLLQALGLLLGERGSSDLIRAKADELCIVGRFEFTRPALKDAVRALVPTAGEGDEVILSRRLAQSGRSYAYLDEQPIAVNTLRQLGRTLVDIHGQRESQSLLEPAYQLRLLDAFGGLESYREAYQAEAEQVRGLRRRHAALTAERQQRQRELALIHFEREELEKADLHAAEMEELGRERQRLSHAQALQEFAANGVSRLHDDEDSVVVAVGKLVHQARNWEAVDPALGEVVRRLEALRGETEDLAETLRDLSQHWEADPKRQEEVEDRWQYLRRLESKYGRPIADLIAYRDTLAEQEARLRHDDSEQESVHVELSQAFARLCEAANDLTKQRQRVAKRMATEVQKELADLCMPDARLDAVLETILPSDAAGDIPEMGFDQFELTLAANPGEPARPLRKVASGGELSRTMLALKTVLASHDQVGTLLVFDEIDANVGGRLGDVLGEKLAALGRSHQVICVTHLPQVASYARHQWSIRKARRGKRTTTTIERLGDKDRLEELASMLRGEARGATTFREAAAMLEAAREHW